MKVGVAAALVLLGTFAGLTVAGVTPAAASTLDGLATLASGNGLQPLDSGGSADDFTVALAPNGTVPAACSGDTASHGYHVYSYLVPQGTSPTSESFATGFPSIDYGLVTDSGQNYEKVNTGIGTGQVLSPPNNLQFAELLSKGVTLDDLLYSDGNTSGIWEAGIACANSTGAVTDYWNVEVTFTASGTDPNGFVWTAPAVPAAPNAPTGTFGNTSANVNWVAPTDVGSSPITGYVLTPYIGATAQTAIDLGNVTTDDVTGLTNGTSYTFTVAAINSVGTILASPFSASITPATVPSQPAAPTATSASSSAIVDWTAPGNGGAAISHYIITPYIGATAQASVEVGNVLTDDVTGLTDGTGYTFTVAAVNVAGTGAASSASNSVTPEPAPDQPAAPTATAGIRSATVDWTAPSDEGPAINGYVLTPYIGATAQTAIDLGNVLTDNVTGLTNGATYTFTVAATNVEGTGAASPASNSVTLPTVPGAPTVIGVTAGKGSVKVTWKAPSSDGGSAITHYVIKPSSGSPVTVGDVTSDTVTRLTNGTAYTFTVAATNSAGTGAASAKSKSVTPDGLYIVTKTLSKATKGKKYTAVRLTEKNGKGTEKWTGTGLPKGLTLSSAGVLSGTVKSTDAVKTYSVTVTVKDSSKPKQTATRKFSLVVLK